MLAAVILILAFMLWRRKVRAKQVSAASKRRLSAKIERVRRLSGAPPADGIEGAAARPRGWKRGLAVLILPIAIFLPMTERIFRDWVLKGVKKGLNKHKAKMRILVTMFRASAAART